MNSLSYDIGGTKSRIVLYNSKFNILKEITYPTKRFFNKNGLSDLKILVETSKHDFGNKFDTVGVSFNCPIKNNKIFYSSLLGGKIDVDLKKTFREFISFNNFVSDNDVFCMAKAEIKFGKAKSYKNILYINIGTGLRVVATDGGNIVRGWKKSGW